MFLNIENLSYLIASAKFLLILCIGYHWPGAFPECLSRRRGIFFREGTENL